MVEAWQQAVRCDRETQKLEWRMAARLATPDGDDGLEADGGKKESQHREEEEDSQVVYVAFCYHCL